MTFYKDIINREIAKKTAEYIKTLDEKCAAEAINQTYEKLISDVCALFNAPPSSDFETVEEIISLFHRAGIDINDIHEKFE